MVLIWYKEVSKTLWNKPYLKGIIAGNFLNISSWLDCNFVKGILRYKNKILIVKKENLREKLVSVAYDSYVGGQIGM